MWLNLHPETQAYLAKRGKERTDYSTCTVAEIRKNVGRSDDKFEEFLGSRFELFLPTSDKSHNIPIYIYRPVNYETNAPIFIFFHGGAMVAGNRLSCDSTCKQLCDLCQCLIVNVEYRLYPEVTMLEPYDDAVTAVEWVKKHKQLIGGGPRSKIGVGGASAGGKIAASVAHDVSDLAFQILVYPHLSNGYNFLPSHKEFQDGPILTLAMAEWVDQFGVHSSHPRSASLLRPYFHHLPPTFLIVAEIDFLRDESYEYAKKLDQSNVTHAILLMKGVTHGFYSKSNQFKDNCKIAFNATHEFIKKHGLTAFEEENRNFEHR